MLQYALIFESVRIQMPFPFIVFLFIFLSPLSSLYSFFFFFFSLLSHSSLDISHPFILPRRSLLLWFFFFFCNDLMGGFGSGWLLSSVQPRRATRCRSLLLWGFFFFWVVIWWVGSAMGGFSLFRSASPPHLMPISNANLCVFCCYFCFSVVVVLVFCCVIYGVRRWWVGCGWGIDGCWQ